MIVKPDIIIITEVNSKILKNKMQESEFNIDGYDLICANVGVIHYRGIVMFVNKFIQCAQIDIHTNIEECLFVLIKGANSSILLIGVFYRSPNSVSTNDMNLFNCLETLKRDFNHKILLLGDLNLLGIN